ncbi:sulfate ABC transporter permease [Planobispora rosea]|uniref:Sulfate ABC transporter permease n=1 Tax=Planobispora rosea TaxID=35762 RepID=A0A8J3WE12_PLARO|nr:ABC transporter permease [Planobispora rosea]GGS71073.1 sulfate ABC transporter permease [Planobispora rosea]GIH85427.1 sulfate ABC transporter permease [Planobispora rosea]
MAADLTSQGTAGRPSEERSGKGPEVAVDARTPQADIHARQLAGLDALELSVGQRRGFASRLWSGIWPVASAIVIVLAVWQGVVLAGWWPEYVFAGPVTTLTELADRMGEAEFYGAVAVTMRRAVVGFALAIAVGLVVGALVSRIRPLRRAVGSLITGLQTMPSIAWFPLAILLFGLTESAITFVVILGAAPSIANGLIAGVDYTPPILLRAGHMLGLRRLSLYRHVILPASLPSFLAGLKQGWAFAWRSLMAGELLVIIANQASLGEQLHFARELADSAGLLATMIVILVIGIAVDLLFGAADTALRRRWGLHQVTT